MNAKIESNGSSFDVVKWVIALALFIGGVVANQYFSMQPIAIRLAGWIILACLIAVIAFQTSQGKQVWAFAQESRIELRKVVWPTRQEVIQTTLIVVAMVVVMALVLWAVDSFLLWGVSFLTGQRG